MANIIRNKQTIWMIAAICITLFYNHSISAAETPKNYNQWLKLPSKQLIDMGSNYAEIQGKADSALVCFTIVTNRYDPKMSNNDKKVITTGYIGKWYVYFFSFFDYTQSYENLAHAQELAEQTGQGLGRVFLNFGCMYQTISEQSGDLKPDSLALEYYKKSFWQSKNEHDNISKEMAFANMITVAYTLNQLKNIDKELADYRLNNSKGNSFEYNILLYNGLKHMQEGNYKQAIDCFDKQNQTLNNDIGNTRYHYVIFTNKARAYSKMGNYAKAIELMAKADGIANTLDMKDARLETYQMLSEIYQKTGNKQLYDTYRNRYFQLKDTLLNYHQVASVGELRFLGEMKKVDKQMQEMEHQQRTQKIIIRTIFGVAMLILATMVIVWRKNRQLRQRNEMLYRKNVETLQREEELKQQRLQLEEQIRQQSANTNNKGEEQQKYRSSTLNEETKQQLMARIRAILDSSEEIFSSDFSAQRLATLADAKYNYVSQTINECSGTNFNSLLNEYRIKEACKRINDHDNYGKLTIEAIGNSVGFKSRTTFIKSFKQQTGLTPSEYQRIARENNA